MREQCRLGFWRNFTYGTECGACQPDYAVIYECQYKSEEDRLQASTPTGRDIGDFRTLAGPDVDAFSQKLALHKSDGKPLVGDMDPTFILEMGEVMRTGLLKYPNDPDGKPNWWKGGDYRSFIASIWRHLMYLAQGEDLDLESNLPHAAHIAVDAMFIEAWRRRGVGNDNRLVN